MQQGAVGQRSGEATGRAGQRVEGGVIGTHGGAWTRLEARRDGEGIGVTRDGRSGGGDRGSC